MLVPIVRCDVYASRIVRALWETIKAPSAPSRVTELAGNAKFASDLRACVERAAAEHVDRDSHECSDPFQSHYCPVHTTNRTKESEETESSAMLPDVPVQIV